MKGACRKPKRGGPGGGREAGKLKGRREGVYYRLGLPGVLAGLK